MCCNKLVKLALSYSTHQKDGRNRKTGKKKQITETICNLQHMRIENVNQFSFYASSAHPPLVAISFLIPVKGIFQVSLHG